MLLFQQHQLPPDRVEILLFYVIVLFSFMLQILGVIHFRVCGKRTHNISQKALVSQIVGTGRPFWSTGGPFGPPVNMLEEALRHLVG